MVDEVGRVLSRTRPHQGQDVEVRALGLGPAVAAVHAPQPLEAEYLDTEPGPGGRDVAQLSDSGELTDFHKGCAPFDRVSSALPP